MKKFLLMLCLSIGATTFASTGKTTSLKNAPKSEINVVNGVKKFFKAYTCETSCDGVTFTFQAENAAEAVAIASRYCGGGVIKMTRNTSIAEG